MLVEQNNDNNNNGFVLFFCILMLPKIVYNKKEQVNLLFDVVFF